MTPAERAARLSHDVGKYIARVARNVPRGEPVPEALVPLLIADLYARPGARFELLRQGLEHSRLEVVERHLEHIAALEARVRGGDATARTEACEAARAVETELRLLAEELTR